MISHSLTISLLQSFLQYSPEVFIRGICFRSVRCRQERSYRRGGGPEHCPRRVRISFRDRCARQEVRPRLFLYIVPNWYDVVRCYRAHHKLKELHTDCIDLHGFLKFSKTHNNLLYPAYALQARIIENVCGDSFWAKQAEIRLSISQNKYVPVTKLLGDSAAAGKKKRKPTVVTSSDQSPPPGESALTGTNTNVRVRKKSTDGSGNAKAASTFPSRESNSPTKASPSKTHASNQARRKSAPKVQPFDSFVTSTPLPSPIDVRPQQQ